MCPRWAKPTIWSDGGPYSWAPLDDRVAQVSTYPHLGIFIFDLKTGNPAAWLLIERNYREIFDVVVSPGGRRPIVCRSRIHRAGIDVPMVLTTVGRQSGTIGGRNHS